jgi:hypothetical protein
MEALYFLFRRQAREASFSISYLTSVSGIWDLSGVTDYLETFHA